MKRVVLGLMCLALAGCDEAAMGTLGGGGASVASGTGGGGAFREFMVIGNRMSFEQCRASGGLIIHDAGSPMTACDPSVRGEPVPANEFDHPASQATAAREAAEQLEASAAAAAAAEEASTGQ